MTCCPENIIGFSNVSETNIPYALEYGAKPTVTVIYNIDGTWTLGVMTQIELQGNPVDNIYINHGGLATGRIKIS